MLSVTAAQLRDRVRVYTDTVNASTPTDGQIDGLLNAGLRSLYARIAEGGSEFLDSGGAITTAAGVATLELEEDVWKLRFVGWERGTRDTIPLRRFSSRDRARLLNRQWSEGARYRFAGGGDGGLTGPLLELCPPPDGAYRIVYTYIPDPPTIDDDGDPLAYVSGMDEYIILCATITILAAEETDTSVWMALREDVYATQVVPSLGGRDEYRNARVSDDDDDGDL
jgi:hypothetical protein